MVMAIAHMISIGKRLNDFKILIGNDFSSETNTGATRFESFAECTHFLGTHLF